MRLARALPVLPSVARPATWPWVTGGSRREVEGWGGGGGGEGGGKGGEAREKGIRGGDGGGGGGGGCWRERRKQKSAASHRLYQLCVPQRLAKLGS